MFSLFLFPFCSPHSPAHILPIPLSSDLHSQFPLPFALSIFPYIPPNFFLFPVLHIPLPKISSSSCTLQHSPVNTYTYYTLVSPSHLLSKSCTTSSFWKEVFRMNGYFSFIFQNGTFFCQHRLILKVIPFMETHKKLSFLKWPSFPIASNAGGENSYSDAVKLGGADDWVS